MMQAAFSPKAGDGCHGFVDDRPSEGIGNRKRITAGKGIEGAPPILGVSSPRSASGPMLEISVSGVTRARSMSGVIEGLTQSGLERGRPQGQYSSIERLACPTIRADTRCDPGGSLPPRVGRPTAGLPHAFGVSSFGDML
jgi:hypothetical protein